MGEKSVEHEDRGNFREALVERPKYARIASFTGQQMKSYVLNVSCLMLAFTRD